MESDNILKTSMGAEILGDCSSDDSGKSLLYVFHLKICTLLKSYAHTLCMD